MQSFLSFNKGLLDQSVLKVRIVCNSHDCRFKEGLPRNNDLGLVQKSICDGQIAHKSAVSPDILDVDLHEVCSSTLVLVNYSTANFYLLIRRSHRCLVAFIEQNGSPLRLSIRIFVSFVSCTASGS